MAQSPVRIEAPAVNPLPYGLLSAALVQDETDAPRWLMAGVTWPPAYCGPAYLTAEQCWEATNDPLDVGDMDGEVTAISTGGVATTALTGVPVPATSMADWGDGTAASPFLDGHTYDAPGTYTVTVRDGSPIPRWYATAEVTYDDAVATGPFALVFSLAVPKVVTDGVDYVGSTPFAAYHLYQCRLVGQDVDPEERAREALRLGEQRAAEIALSMALPAADNAVDLTPTPGTAVHPVDGLGILEKFAAANYGGVPVVHVERNVGTVLTTLGSVIRGSGRLETVQGALVSSGGGYDLDGPGETPVTPGAGEAWLYVTGTVVARRSAVIEVNEIAGSVQANEFMALAERPYVLAWECITAAVLVDTAYGTPS